MKQQKQIQQENQKQEQEVISEELIRKFDNDRELVQKFVDHGYSVEQLQNAQITHPTYSDPAVVLNGKTIGFWLP